MNFPMSDITYTAEDLENHDAVAAVIKDSQGNILVQDHVKFGFWTIPIGKAKPGQTPEEGLRQELKEECGINVVEFRKIGTKVKEYERNGKIVKLTVHLYDVHSYRGKIENKEPTKHRTQKFMTVQEIMKLPYLSDSIILYLQHIGHPRQAQL